MRMLRLVLVLLVLGGCDEGADPQPQIDAPAEVDAPMTTDGPVGTACTGAAYDPCTENTQCMSNRCHLYQAQNLQVCVPTCTPGDNSTCPVDRTGVNGTCNNMGICRPAAANDCTRP
jgi:hypothetical protein